MSAIPEWSVPFTLTTPAGTIDFNTADEDGRRYRLIPDQCQASQDVVALKRKISGGDGDILAHRSKSGFVARLALQMFQDGAFAITDDLVEMVETLQLCLDSLFNPSLANLVGSCRLQWTPSGSEVDWMLDRLRLLERLNATGTIPKTFTFAVDTELPYALREDQQTTSLVDGVTQTIDHDDGSTDTFPVIKVYASGADVHTFTIVNTNALDPNGNPKQIVYDDSLPGASAIADGHYVEITTFRETVVLDGDVTFGSLAGIDIPVSELRLPIVPGANDFTIIGADADILWNSARA